MEQLSLYCNETADNQIFYKYFLIPKTQKYQCRVKLNDSIYSTYPNEYDTQEEAQLEAAQIALKSLQEKDMRERYPICVESSIELAIKVLECIGARGVFEHKIPELFQ